MLINWTDLFVFTTAALLLNLTPGNDMMFVLGQAMKSGAKAGVAASLGIATGSAVHLALVGFGVALILSQNPLLFEMIRWAGAAYLIWLAIQALRSSGTIFDLQTGKLNLFSAWRDGVLVNLFNPKIIVFFFAFLPPFIRPENGSPLLQLLILGTIFNVGGTIVNIIVSAFAGAIRQRLTSHTSLKRVMSYASAAIFFGLALRLITQKR